MDNTIIGGVVAVLIVVFVVIVSTMRSKRTDSDEE